MNLTKKISLFYAEIFNGEIQAVPGKSSPCAKLTNAILSVINKVVAAVKKTFLPSNAIQSTPFSFCKFQAAKLSTKCLVSSPSSTKAKCTRSARSKETSMTDLGAPPAPIKNTNTGREVALGVIVTQSCAKAIVILGWQADGPVHFFLKPWLSLNFLTERSVTLPGKGNL